MPATELPTHFASPERLPPRELQQQIALFSDPALTWQLLDAMPNLLMILNGQRQIIYANQTLVELVAGDDERLFYGLRPGEVLGCTHADTEPGGCGTAEPCSTCGAVLAILAGLEGRQETRECRVTRSVEGREECLDLRVSATPLIQAGEPFAILTVNDISHEKRRRILERLFFHDILNILGTIRGFAELLPGTPPAKRPKTCSMIQTAAQRTIEEIETQRILAAAENNELQIQPEPLRIADFLHQVVDSHRRLELARERLLAIDPEPPDKILVSDRALLGRVLGNMLKNALEASAPGETVTVGCSWAENGVRFSVHNPAVIPPTVQLQIFQRSFSTKGSGRGLGTYCLRLLCNYLQSEVKFTSKPDEGTVFSVFHPLKTSDRE